MERPTGVTILAVLALIGAGLSVVAALLVLLGGAMVANMASRPGLGMMAGVGGVIIGVFLLGVAALYAVAGVGFLKLQNWARILVVVLCGLGRFLTRWACSPLSFTSTWSSSSGTASWSRLMSGSSSIF